MQEVQSGKFKCDLLRRILAVTLKLPQFPHLLMDVRRVNHLSLVGGLQAYVWDLQAIISDLRPHPCPPAATVNTITLKKPSKASQGPRQALARPSPWWVMQRQGGQQVKQRSMGYGEKGESKRKESQ